MNPWPPRLCWTAGSAMIRRAAASRRSTIAGGSRAGAHRPYQVVNSKSLKPDSCIVGTSGNSALRVDPVTHRVTGNGQALELGPTEFRLLHFFMTHAERVHSRSQLLDQVWGDHIFVEERTVDVHIRRLRVALEQTGHDRLIQTVRGTGYRFSIQPE